MDGNVRALYPIFDYNNRLENRIELEENIKRRGLADQINIGQLYEQWELFKRKNSEKDTIEKRRTKLGKMIRQLFNTSESAQRDSEIETYRQELRALHKTERTISKEFSQIEDAFNLNFLELPNVLLPNTPDQPKLLHNSASALRPAQSQHHLRPSPSHLIYEHLIEYISESSYFLRNEASMFDLYFPMKCVHQFRRNGFESCRNPDFAKTVVVEGGAVRPANVYEIPHDFNKGCTNMVHLVGSGAWLSFLGFIAKMKTDKRLLPMQLVTTGKIYKRTEPNDLGLYDATQSTVVQIFSAGTAQQITDKFQTTLELIRQIYESLDIEFRIVQVPADQLLTAECFAARIEMYSLHLQSFVEVGRVSNHSNYISNRLRFQCERDETNTCYKPHILSATVCNVTKLIAIILETHNGHIPPKFLSNNAFK